MWNKLFFLFSLNLLLAVGPKALSQDANSVIGYNSTVSSDSTGPLDLFARIDYDTARAHAPIAVVMHGYGQDFDDVLVNAQRLRDSGFFVISVGMRNRNGSDGTFDSGGVEIYDIYDAVEHVKVNYSEFVDPCNVHITGYSGGGGNVMSALTKFPDYFRVGAAFFGMSDYGYDPVNGWYFNGATSSHQGTMRTYIGDPTLGDPNITARYAARASNLASHNNPYSEIHLFVNYDEQVCPVINDTSYRDNAIAHANFPGEFGNITVHIGGKYDGEDHYEDFNWNGVNEPNELQNWPHGYPNSDQQHAAEAWYLGRLLDGSIPQPVLNPSDELYVAGYVKTQPFSLWLGNGQNAAGELSYSLSVASKTFELDILTSDQTIMSALTVQTADMAGHLVVAKVNGIKVEEFEGGVVYVYNGLGHGDLLELLSSVSIWYVDDDAPADPGPNNPAISDPSENGSSQHPFDTIQEAIDVAVDTEIIIVLEGTYYENISSDGYDVILQSTDPDDSNVVADTVIDGNYNGSAVTFTGTEGPNCVLTGFTITNGYLQSGGSGISGNGTHASISRCAISNNGGLNSGPGGAIADCNGSINNCTVTGNFSGETGGGLYYCNGPITNCTISNNYAEQFGGGLAYCSGLITNCIVWANTANVAGDQFYSCSEPDYSCIQDWSGSGIGNIASDPCFADPGNDDYHLKSDRGRWDPNGGSLVFDDVTSQCIDAGDPNSDYIDEPYPNGSRINIGAYGSTAEASRSPSVAAVKINFQPAGSEIPAGYEPDFGDAFGDRGNGFAYGWTPANYNARERGADPDQRYDTFNHLQKSGEHTWEIVLANGTYDVYLVCGEPSYADQINTLDIEGMVLTDPDGPDYFDEYYVVVEVADRRLTIGPAAGASNAKICFIEIASVWLPLDTTPPTPDPMTWATLPYATGDSSIAMVAATASDASGVEYYFAEASGNPGGSDSGWQDSPTYEDTGLGPDTQYSYQVKARDKSVNQNETGWSTEAYATTEPPDTAPPSPDPMSWGTIPYATSSTSIAMVAATASDASGVEYYFAETSGQPGGSDSGWQDSPMYEDVGLDPDTQYSYQVKARDKSVNQNETGWSTEQYATTEPPDMTPPTPDPMTWATAPYATSNTSIAMVATTASDASGVEYYFAETSGQLGGLDSGWQDSPTYEDTGLDPDTQYSYQVKARDKSVNQNETGWSASEPATTPIAPPPADIKINFQPSGSAVPAGYEPDFGDAYGDRGNGLTYGWDGANYNTRERGADPDREYDTLNHMQKSGYHIWEIELTNGTYDVHLVCGDPSYDDQINHIDVEGTVLTDPDGPDYFDEYTVEVEVTDGRLTFGPAAGASNSKVCFIEITSVWVLPDTTAPTPDPMTWATVPYATGDSSIAMVATMASDASGVEYYFQETSGNPGGSDSGWQDSTTYEDTGLDPNTQYSYQVKARDKSINQNETGWSTEEYATTEPLDAIPPSPDPMNWGIVPYATSSTSIAMVATTASDASGVEYYFAETSGQPGGSDSGWQDSPMYEDTGLDPNTQYSYQVKARDKSINQNETGWSTSEPATTLSGPANLVAAYGMNEGTGSTVNDASGNGNDGTLAGVSWAASGYFGGALDFETNPGHVDLHNLDIVGDELTIVLWFRADDFGISDARLISKATGTSSGAHYWMISTYSGPKLRFRLKTGVGGTTTLVASTGTLTAGVWTHVAATYDGSAMRLYKDGVEVGSMVKTGMLSTNPAVPAWIGTNPNGYGTFDGLIDEVKIFNVALTPSEIQFERETPIGGALPPNTTPPTPDPMTWVTPPYATGDSSIAMVATTASDASGVEYYFAETSGQPGGSDSGWQDSPMYEDTGLDPNTQYSYQVKARDKSANQNETGWSTEEYATTELPDTTPPTPDPMTWVTPPYATGSTSIVMVATTASDASGVEYYFAETSGQPGGSDSGWQDNPVYEDTGLDPNTQYCYQVKARDKSVNQNETGWSTEAYATTEPPDTAPPSPDPMSWGTVPYATSSTSIAMVATTASDASGVEYYFQETSGSSGGSDSGWQDSPTYEDTGLDPDTQYSYQVKARDKSVNQNETGWSTSEPATTPIAPPPADIRINFQPSGSVVPAGYEPDFGDAYGDRGNGLTYGWDGANYYTRERGVDPDQRYDTFNHMQKSDDAYQIWEIELANGRYSVYLVCGDPSWGDQINTLDIEPKNLTFISGTGGTVVTDPDGGDYFDEYYVEVEVADGRLTIRPAIDLPKQLSTISVNSKLCFIEISSVAAPPDDITPPVPDPMTWTMPHYATGPTSVWMMATTASDPSGVEYYFEETSGSPGGSDSGWQESPIYEDTGLAPNTQYSYRVKTRDKSANQNETGWSTSESAVPRNAIRINFQEKYPWIWIPAGYEPDYGFVYGDRGNGLTYGWDLDQTTAHNVRGIDPDHRYDTLIHMQKWGDRTWEIELANGTYDVYLVCGDPSNDNQINTVDIEGTVLTDPDGLDYFDEYSVEVEVTDGRLTIRSAAGAIKAKICFVEIAGWP